MEALERVQALEDIKRLKAAYFRTMDLKDWTAYAQTFALDGVLEVVSIRRASAEGAPIARREQGRDAIVRWVSGVLDGAITIHHGHMPEIEILSPDAARGVWAMEDRVIWPDRWLHGWGHYHETYVRQDGAWRIATSRLTRLKVETSPAPSVSSDGPRMLDF